MCSIDCRLCVFCGEGCQFFPPSVVSIVCWLNGKGLDTSKLFGLEKLFLIVCTYVLVGMYKSLCSE